MKSIDHRIVTAAAALSLLGSIAHADLIAGYTIGAGSQLLAANGGDGDTLFADEAALGGDNQTAPAGANRPFDAVLLDGAGLWSIGDTVEITGVALPIRGGGGTSASGTWTFEIRQGAGGTGASQAAGLSALGTATAVYTAPPSLTAQVVYANFDTPVSFVADANSTTIGIQFSSTGQIQYKDNTVSNLVRYNHDNGNIVGGATPRYIRFSVAGNVTVIPEPSSLALVGSIGLLGFCLRRRWS
jgi:hypothetical protein